MSLCVLCFGAEGGFLGAESDSSDIDNENRIIKEAFSLEKAALNEGDRAKGGTK